MLKEKAWEGYQQQYGGNIDHIYSNGVSSQVIFDFPTATDAGKLSAHDAADVEGNARSASASSSTTRGRSAARR